ncbi:hypothetical protein ACIPEN_00970 [Herbaspirillum chlorophenolicum]|uniref:SGNH hydrolase-type esterase domain-containing protein n=1 Tax=Herbaspirillum chlorophenolicum TaxID=211589 RepID=A0ABW8ESK6_9BURK
MEWKVSNPFPFIKSKDQVDLLVAGLQEIEGSSNFGPYSDAVKASYRNTEWNPDSGQYNKSYIHSDQIAIEIRLNSASGDSCKWSTKYQSVSQTCDKPVVLNIDSTESDNVALDISGEHYTYSIKPTINIILALGDSFAAGEGNPDRPSTYDLAKITNKGERNSQRRWPSQYKFSAVETADWNDPKFHRSLYSWQFLSALKQSTKAPHTVTKFVSYSCSGAEIFDGLFTRQIKDGSGSVMTYKAPQSQVDAAIDLLCSETSSITKVKLGRKQKLTSPGSPEFDVFAKKCASEKLVKPAHVLLAIGGNDVGFSGLIMWASFPDRGRSIVGSMFVSIINARVNNLSPFTCPGADAIDKFNDTKCWGEFNGKQLFRSEDAFTNGWLRNELNSSYGVIQSLFQVGAGDITQISYPMPTHDANGKICETGDSLNAFRALRNALFEPLDRFSRYYNQYSIGPEKQHVKFIENGVARRLNEEILKGREKGINVVDVVPPFNQHGFCASKSGPLALEIPYVNGKGRWDPFPLSRTSPWLTTDRWFRTANDVYINQQSDSAYGNEAWTKGIFHPNHLGHRAIYLATQKN